MIYSFHPDAEEEFNQAIEYYEEIDAGLGFDFAMEVYSTILRSATYPKHGLSCEVISGDLWSEDSHMEYCTLKASKDYLLSRL